jgi:hypothetical protein
MVQMKTNTIGLLVACVILSSTAFTQDGEITVVLSSTTVHGFAGINYGMDFAIRNVDTYEVHKSEPLNPLVSKYTFIDNLQSGRYEVVYLGSHEFPRIDSVVQKFFGIIELTKGESYFLGNFRGKVPIGRNMPSYIDVSVGAAPERLVRVLRKREILEEDQELIALPSYERDSLMLRPIK